MAPATTPRPGRRSRLSGPLALATAAAAGYLATVGFAPSSSAWVGPAASRLGSRHRSVAAQAMADPETEVRGGRGMDYYDYDYDQEMDNRREDRRGSDREVDQRRRGFQGGGRDGGGRGRRQKRIWKYKTPVEDLKVGTEYEATVIRKWKNSGVLVDIGAERSGWLHVTEIDADAGVEFEIPLKDGEKVWVRVLHVNRATGKFSVTCLQGDLTRQTKDKVKFIDDMSPFLVQTPFDGKVSSITTFGAFVEVKVTPDSDPVYGLLHRDYMTPDMKASLAEGDEVKLKLIKVDEREGQIAFKALEYKGQPVDFEDTWVGKPPKEKLTEQLDKEPAADEE